MGVSVFQSKYFHMPNHILLTCCFIHSGYVLGLVLQAVVVHQSGSVHPDLIHVTAHFIKSAMVGPFEVHIRTIKIGKGFKNLMATLVQHVHISPWLHPNCVTIG